jgi:hypothetical protein
MIDQYPPSNGVLTSLIWRKTATGGETSLSGYDNASQALSYTPGQEQVYLNGILLVRGDDYTATNGTSITGLVALAAGDFIQINCYNNFSVATLPATSITGTITGAQIDSTVLKTSGGQSITYSGSSPALTITNTGSGHSLLVEDATSTDSTPFVIDSSGNVGIGSSSNLAKLVVNGAVQLGNSGTATNNWHITTESSDGSLKFWNGNYGSGNHRLQFESDGRLKLNAGSVLEAPLTQNQQSGTSYTLTLTDAGKLVELNNASAISLTVPLNSSVAFPVGTQIHLLQTGAGQVNVSGGGIALNATPGTKLRTQWSSATLIKRATDTWVLIGDLTA